MGYLGFKYLASVGKGKIKKIVFWTMISFPQWLKTERKELKEEAGVKRAAM